ncbi:metallophosphoesterase domain-containing protein 1-like isoform X1 [Tachypleus tridentatus]|uniref:metallophosphoesterase domain-containing protein 1-like isoform X1 n=2 Tax=Tachypleus tridentatus TaxID=6853 RepID=UPI003FD35870
MLQQLKGVLMSHDSLKEASIEIHHFTKNPSKAWEELRKFQVIRKVQPIPLALPVNPNKVRFVCMSDTHSFTSFKKWPIPSGDVFIHAGDFTKFGFVEEVEEFNKFLGALPHTYKIVIAGNHEFTFDPSKCDTGNLQLDSNDSLKCTNNKPQNLLTNCIYLEDSAVEIHGLKVYGSPWQPFFRNGAFNLPRGKACLKKWNKIPTDVDVLITHTPPVGHGDYCLIGVHAGCVELLNTVQNRVKPKYHVFGHIHEGYGITTDDKTIFVNCSTCNTNYIPINPPIIFDISLPSGFSKI